MVVNRATDRQPPTEGESHPPMHSLTTYAGCIPDWAVPLGSPGLCEVVQFSGTVVSVKQLKGEEEREEKEFSVGVK